MRILLDTNVWEYLSQGSTAERLRVLASRVGHEILVAPAVVYEALRNPDQDRRQATLNFLTNVSWTRLMPEAYSEADEILQAFRRLRPEWLEPNPDLGSFLENRRDWTSRTGIWRRARLDPGGAGSTIEALQGAALLRARKEAIARRAVGENSDWNFDSTDLRRITADIAWNGQRMTVDGWRAASAHAALRDLKLATLEQHPYADWLLCFLRRSPFELESWTRFWFEEVDAAALPRQWMRWALEILAVFRKVSPGTPSDTQIATHLVEADVFLTCDRVFASMLTKCRAEAPFRVAETRLLPGGSNAVGALFEFLPRQ